jgi:hypothetical protein
LLEAISSFILKQYEHLLVENDILKNGDPTDPCIVDQAIQMQYDIALEEHLTLREHIYELENKIKVLEEASKNNVIKALTKHELVFQEFLASSIARTKLAFMIYKVSINYGEGIGFSGM